MENFPVIRLIAISGFQFHFYIFTDPVSWYIGDPVPRWNISGSGADLANGLIISLTTGVTHSVIVFAWEMNVNKSGSLDIVVINNMLFAKSANKEKILFHRGLTV